MHFLLLRIYTTKKDWFHWFKIGMENCGTDKNRCFTIISFSFVLGTCRMPFLLLLLLLLLMVKTDAFFIFCNFLLVRVDASTESSLFVFFLNWAKRLNLHVSFVGPFWGDGTHVDKYTRNYEANSYINLSLLFYVLNSFELAASKAMASFFPLEV